MPEALDSARRRDRAGALPDAERLRALVAEHFAIVLGPLDRVSGGYDAFAAVWMGEDADGVAYGIKASRRDTRFGLALADSLTRAGVEGIVAPEHATGGMPWVEVDGAVVSVSRWVTGWDATEPGSRLQWERFGATLRAVHDHRPPATAQAPRRGIRRFRRSPARLVAGVDRMLGPTAHLASGDRELAARWMDMRERLLRLVRVERELKRVRLPSRRVSLHGDPHLGNVVVDDDGRPWLIDFDEAAVAPREADLMLVELGVLFSAPITDEQRAAFRAGYGEVDVDAERIARFGCVRAVEDTAATFRQAFRARGADRTQCVLIIDGIAGPHGLVSLVEAELDRLGL